MVKCSLCLFSARQKKTKRSHWMGGSVDGKPKGIFATWCFSCLSEKTGNTDPIGSVSRRVVEVFKAPVQPFAVLNDRECAWSTTGADSFDLTKPTNHSIIWMIGRSPSSVAGSLCTLVPPWCFTVSDATISRWCRPSRQEGLPICTVRLLLYESLS